MVAKPMKYVSLAHLTLSLVSCTSSSGISCKSCTECPGLQKCLQFVEFCSMWKLL